VRVSFLWASAMALALLSAKTSAGLGEEAVPTPLPSVVGSQPLPDAELTQIPVATRPHRDFDPLGVQWGALFFYPSVTGGLMYNSNVFASPKAAQADFAFVLSPRLTIDYEKPRSSYRAQFGADFYQFREFTEENRINGFARLQSSNEVSEDLELQTSFEAARKHDVPGEASSQLNAAEPIPYTDLRAETTVTKTFNRLGVSIDGTARGLTYQNVDSFSGELLDQTWRDGTILTASVKPFYELSPGYRAFVRLRGNSRNYAGEGELNRDADGYDLHGGTEFVLTPLILGSVEVGYLSETYANPLIQPIDGTSFLANATWLMTPLMTVTVAGERSVAETTTPDFFGRVDTGLGVRLDYELLRNLIVSAGPKFVRQDFPDSSRKDDVVMVEAGFNYLINPFARLGIDYDYVNRDSTLPEYSFDQHVVTLNVTAQY
jgi:hypothetical protein